MSSELPTFRNGTKYQECLLKGHDYFSIDTKYLSKNVTESELICLDCGNIRYVYNYLEYEI